MPRLARQQTNRRHADVCVVVTIGGKQVTLRGLLDSGCSKSIVLKQFTTKKKRVKLNPKDCIKYETYGGYFRSDSEATVDVSLVEFTKFKHKVTPFLCQVF